MGGKGTDGAWVKQDQSRAGIAETGCACVLCDEIGRVCVALGRILTLHVPTSFTIKS